MDSLSYKTQFVNKANADKNWVLVDAKDKVLGRVCSDVAKILRGKNKTSFSPNSDCGDNVIVINSDHIKLTGKKWTDKKYVRHTGYTGGQKISNPLIEKAKSSTRLIEYAVKGMLPKNKLGRAIFKNLHVFEGTEHTHEAQKPVEIKF